ncbi:tRNA (5-methylaminomethyl-2-thiouridine)(34)-methyltransferase MnmD [Yunchengibacter salinarum]|uniref:tRNA (5-methylaminomethyl-2-thiouridine)(34)-methyltransferase MnmD n=1 Tax=Yunchengibacter salinarum TaxID=3133399 RepID=UPI0035B64D97
MHATSPPLAPSSLALETARLDWSDHSPHASAYGDCYYNPADGLGESRFTFLDGVELDRIIRARQHPVIMETGFGTGLNFLASWAAWRDHPARGDHLTFLSVEAHPLSRADLARAHRAFPELAPLSQRLIAAWPPPSRGVYHCPLGPDVTLILSFGEAESALQALSGEADAWYLDGFAPSRNPAMWRDSVLDQIARLSRPGTRVATFTAAGFVRRGLAARGFEMRKAPGFGDKRERLLGAMATPAPQALPPDPAPEWAMPAPPAMPADVLVIGGGIAGACVAAACHRRGLSVTLLEEGGSDGASRVPAAVLAPRFVLDDGATARFTVSAFHQAVTGGVPLSGPPGLHLKDTPDRCARLQSHLGWGADWLQETGDGLHLPLAGTVEGGNACDSLLAGIDRRRASVARLTPQDGRWQALNSQGAILATADAVVVAGGMASGDLLQAPADLLPLRPVSGQVARFQTRACPGLAPHSLHDDGYISADVDGWRLVGSTFDPLPPHSRAALPPTAERRARLLDRLMDWLPGDPAAPRPDRPGDDQTCDDRPCRDWTGLRAATPDHLPLAGPVPDWQALAERYAPLSRDATRTGLGPPPCRKGLYLLTGLGAKGFQTAPLLGALIAAQITGAPLPVERAALPHLAPQRFVVRAIKRNKPPAL